jgi:hypothetical protein
MRYIYVDYPPCHQQTALSAQPLCLERGIQSTAFRELMCVFMWNLPARCWSGYSF